MSGCPSLRLCVCTYERCELGNFKSCNSGLDMRTQEILTQRKFLSQICHAHKPKEKTPTNRPKRCLLEKSFHWIGLVSSIPIDWSIKVCHAQKNCHAHSPITLKSVYRRAACISPRNAPSTLSWVTGSNGYLIVLVLDYRVPLCFLYNRMLVKAPALCFKKENSDVVRSPFFYPHDTSSRSREPTKVYISSTGSTEK